MNYLPIINYIVFIIIVVLGFRYLLKNNAIIEDPFKKGLQMQISGIQYLLLFTFSTGIIMIEGLSAERLMVWIVLFLLAIIIDKNSISLNITTIIYFLFLMWLIFSLTYTPVKMYGIRTLLKYTFPFLILVLSSKVTLSDSFFYKAIKVILYLSLFSSFYLLVLNYIPFINTLCRSIFWSFPAIMDFYPVPITIALAYYSYSRQKKYLVYLILFILPSIILVNRTGLLAASITIVIFALIRYRLKSLPYIAIGIALFVSSILYLPSFRDKMFKKQLTSDEIIAERESLTSEDINSSGRFAMWEWSLKNYYQGRELKGSGLGVLQAVFYSGNHPFNPIRIVHNDYVQLLCDTGLVGLSLYCLTLISLIFYSFFMFFNKNKIFILRLAALIAGVSLAGMVATLYTDNVVNYSLMTLSYPFGIYGMFIGLKRKYTAINHQ